jgi:two-component system cell cycle response regulator
MLNEMAHAVRPAIDLYLTRTREAHLLAVASHAAVTDPLTRLGNRRSLDENEPTGSYALLSLDIDHFKAVNDTFGHAAGDVVLRRVADTLVSTVREGDAVFRLGGEEFLIVLPDTDEHLAFTIAERVRIAVADVDLAGYAPTDRVSVSIGIATRRARQPGDIDSVLKRADAALYTSKTHGRNRVTVGHT